MGRKQVEERKKERKGSTLLAATFVTSHLLVYGKYEPISREQNVINCEM
jgi:hypothetical protein